MRKLRQTNKRPSVARPRANSNLYPYHVKENNLVRITPPTPPQIELPEPDSWFNIRNLIFMNICLVGGKPNSNSQIFMSLWWQYLIVWGKNKPQGRTKKNLATAYTELITRRFINHTTKSFPAATLYIAVWFAPLRKHSSSMRALQYILFLLGRVIPNTSDSIRAAFFPSRQ